MALPKPSVAATAGGASAEVAGIFDDEPMCMHTRCRSRRRRRRTGPSSPEWIDGQPEVRRDLGEAHGAHAAPALRRTSAAASAASHSGMRQSGISRPPESPHHSSTIQSL